LVAAFVIAGLSVAIAIVTYRMDEYHRRAWAIHLLSGQVFTVPALNEMLRQAGLEEVPEVNEVLPPKGWQSVSKYVLKIGVIEPWCAAFIAVSGLSVVVCLVQGFVLAGLHRQISAQSPSERASNG